jgi:hypothetical protein
VGQNGAVVSSGGTESIAGLFVGSALFEPGTATNRNVVVRAEDNCDQGQHVTIDSVKLNVEGIS